MSSQDSESTPQEVFLRGAWKCVPSEDDLSWVQHVSRQPLSEEPLGDYGALVARMLECGVTEYDIARFAKIVGYETACGIAYHLEDPNASYEDFPDDRNEQLAWQLYLVDDETNQPLEPLTGLHESLLSLDPSGREMRPKSD